MNTRGFLQVCEGTTLLQYQFVACRSLIKLSFGHRTQALQIRCVHTMQYPLF
jgi:hypothetical protein